RLRTEGPGPYRFWYRQSPRYFETINEIAFAEPALDVSGMVSIYLDMEGRLHWFIAVPPQREPAADPNAADHSAPDWSIAFREAGLDIASFQSVPSTRVPLHAYDARAAWDGNDSAHPELKTHVEAAAFRGKLIYFETLYPWDQAGRQERPVESGRERALTFILIPVFLTVLIGSALLARRNLRLGRGDRRGATRVASLYFAVRMLVWLFTEHHNGLAGHEFDLFLVSLSFSLFFASFMWVLYVALEPFVRKRWPMWIISWSRLLAGDFRDPLIGRDVLVGAVAGLGMSLIVVLAYVFPRWIGQTNWLTLNPGSFDIGRIFFIRFVTQLSAAFFIAFIAV